MRNLKSIIITACVCLPLGFAVAGPMKGHANLEAARDALETAFNKISAAQTANEFDMNGHAAKAKEAIETARVEIKQAAEAANAHK